MAKQYDVIAIGTGTAANVAASRCRSGRMACCRDQSSAVRRDLMGLDAEDVMNIFAAAIRQGLTAEQLKSTIFAYPTGASDISYMLP